MKSNIQLIGDNIVALGKQLIDYTDREHAVRDAMLVITIVAPIIGAFAILLARDGWWKKDQRLSAQTVAAAWMLSILAFGLLIHFQHGITTRTTFIVAVMHEQVEVLLDCVLLGFTPRRAFSYTWIFGLVLLFFVLVLPTMSQVFITAAIIGGGNDMLIALLFLYGKQWCFGFAGLAHVVSAIAVFAQAIRNVGVVPFNAVIFLSLWAHVGLTVAGVIRHEERFHSYEGPFLNPLDGVSFKRSTLLKLAAIGVVGSTGVTIYLAYILPIWPKL